MSYKFIFNTDVSGLMWTSLQKAIDAAQSCGYKFILFNGEVYHHSGERTGITAKDCF